MLELAGVLETISVFLLFYRLKKIKCSNRLDKLTKLDACVCMHVCAHPFLIVKNY